MRESEVTWSPCTHVGHGVRICLDWEYHRLAHAADRTIAELTTPYPRAAALYTSLLAEPQILALWDLTSYMAVEKLGLNDHGQMHAQVVAANALQLLDLLHAAGITPDVVTSDAGTLEDAFVVVLAAALLHDVGNQVTREGHETYSVMLAQPVLARHLPALYPDPAQRQVLTGFILSAIASHDCTPAPVTLEGAIVAVADGADMTQGRGTKFRIWNFGLRIWVQWEASHFHKSCLGASTVNPKFQIRNPKFEEVTMDNPAGLFQVEKLLGRKLALSGLDRHVSLRACVAPEEREGEQTLHCLVLREGRFQPESLSAPADSGWPVDPVCGMAVAPEHAAGSIVYLDNRYLFCSSACLTSFRDDPSQYV